MQKDDKWFASINWDANCITCQSDTNGLCQSRSCAEFHYDPWGDLIPASVYHHDGNTLGEYLERKRKQMESGEFVTMDSEKQTNEVLSIPLDDLDIHGATKSILKRRFDSSTIGDLLRAAPDIEKLRISFSGIRGSSQIEKLIRALDGKGVRLPDCSFSEYPDIDNCIFEKVTASTSIAAFGVSEDFVDFLKKNGCQNMADVLKLNPEILCNLTGSLRLEAIHYLRALEKILNWRLLAISKELYPDLETYIAEKFVIKLSNLDFSTRLQNSFIKAGIQTTAQLVQYSRLDLEKMKVAGDRGISEIVKILFDNGLHLSGDIFFNCEICHKKGVKEEIVTTSNICYECAEKQRRIAKMKDIVVTISGPDYGSYTNVSSGFTLYANIENKTNELIEISLIDFYVFSAGRQRAPLYYLNGYSFDTEHIFANTSKTAGKIFSTSGLKYDTLCIDDYAIVKLKTSSTRYRMYKFVYTSSISKTWRIDDYSEFGA